MRHSFFIAVSAFCLLMPNPAFADKDEDTEKYNFFSNTAISREQSLADWDECRDLAGVVKPPPAGYAYSQGAAGAAAAGFLQGLIQGAQRRHMLDATLRKCMALKGYQRYAATKEEIAGLYTGKWPEIRQKLADRAVKPVTGNQRLDP
jgi:hypothetical protein